MSSTTDEVTRTVRDVRNNAAAVRHVVSQPYPSHKDTLATTYHEVVSVQGEPPMKTLVSIITLGLAVAFTVPAFAAEKAPQSKAACEKAHMTWDATSKKCK